MLLLPIRVGYFGDIQVAGDYRVRGVFTLEKETCISELTVLRWLISLCTAVSTRSLDVMREVICLCEIVEYFSWVKAGIFGDLCI